MSTSVIHRSYRCGTWITSFVLIVISWLASPNANAQTPAETGSIADLEAKFIDIKALGGTIQTRYYEEGQGEPLLLVHGGGLGNVNANSANIWSRNIPALGERFHVFAVDKLAAGMTGNPPNDSDYNIQGEIAHMYQFIQTMNLGPVHLVGQSRGAGLGLLLAMQHPEVVRTLVLTNSGTVSPDTNPTTGTSVMEPCAVGDRSWKIRCAMEVQSYAPNIADTWDDEYYAAGEYMIGLPQGQEAQAKMAADAGQPLRSEFNESKKRLHERLRAEEVLPMPVLLYWSKNDPQVTVDRGVALHDILAAQHPKVWLLLINKAGHLHFREYPDQFNHNVMSFIDYWNRQPTDTVSIAP